VIARRQKLQTWIALQAQAISRDHPIASLDAYPVREPVSGRAWTMIRLRTASGLTGWGEGPRVTPADIAKARAAVASRSATAWATMPDAGPLQAAVETAMLDIAAKAAKAPLYRFLGGPTRFKVRALTSCGDDRLSSAVSAGFKAVQVTLPPPPARNLGRAYHAAVLDRMDKLRGTAPAGVNFVLGGNAALSAGDAASIAAELARFHLLWFDEPAPLRNYATIRKIADESVTPLGFGRTVSDGSACQDLLREGIADVLRPDLSRAGISGIRRIAALAETYYVAVAPNHEGGPVGTAAALHLAASLPNFFIQHIPLPEADEDRRMRAALVAQPVETVRDGFAALPAGPGLGIEVNEDALGRYKDGTV
jgi:galactonate dehydratase